MEKHFNCSTAERRLGYAQRIEARFTKKLHKLQALETKAQAAKHTTLAAYWQKIIAHEQKVEAKVVGAKLLARQAKVTRLAQNKCHTSLPTATASTASSTTA
jgi:hypothetical protein